MIFGDSTGLGGRKVFSFQFSVFSFQSGNGQLTTDN